jgi:hypothetical protein
MTIAKNAITTITAAGGNSGIVPIVGPFKLRIGGTFTATIKLFKRTKDQTSIGTQDGGASGTVFTDSTAIAYIADELIGTWIYNNEDTSIGPVTDNNTTTVTATLVGGTTTAWADGNTASIWEEIGSYTAAQYLDFEEFESGCDYMLYCTAFTSGTARIRISN